MLRKIIIIFLGLLSFSQVVAQINQDTTKNRQDLIIQKNRTGVANDSLLIIAREKFVKDSLFRRKQIVDSLAFLKQELPKLMEAIIKSVNEDIVIYTDPVKIIGDSMLSNFTYRILLQIIDQPYAPWRSSIKLSRSSFKLKIDSVNKKISAIRSPEINYSFKYDIPGRIVRMEGQSVILNKKNVNYYKAPIDSALFNREGRVIKLKKYVQYFEATSNYQKGASLYVDLEQIKEFDYFPDGLLSSYRVVNYCDRWSGNKINEVCNTVNYSVTRQDKKFTVLRKNEPENIYSNGTYIFELDNNFDTKSMEFTNANLSVRRKCIIELNNDKNVSRYLYEKDGKINKTLQISYDNSPNAKYKVEIIECDFEQDGISYFQKNKTTGKSRTRDKLTMEWGPWK